jgi:hypothetical protein
VLVQTTDHKVRKKAGELDGASAPLGGDQAGRAAPSVDDATKNDEHRIIICAGCGHRIAEVDARVEIAGRHEHTCVNPGGTVYRILCFRDAPGCTGHGEPSEYFSWFAGYAWQISLCAKCNMHLGWSFEGEPDPFHGLIVDRIEERAIR